MTVPDPALVAAGGAVGAVARHLIGSAVDRDGFPLGTLTVNVVGSLLLGLLVFHPVGGDALLFAGTGACGAFTTFSSFSVGVVRLWDRGEHGRAALFVVANTALAGVGVVAAAVLTGAW
ncbi:fluoride efflux transporter CrcB [Halobaculum sp. CBA1158]|uniref:fluoride efflux transporter CrcB n=1 Tax=Halobaculum sp. CBA1158 TaxID=2904243 RepID=UPI001F1A5421|nr:fluoride efflux transporter CrcB [Halobaculum sp. CBA1158]UIP00555.1 fluoride efflux transporter CrcB [Halobaculum sp. CBA1158]